MSVVFNNKESAIEYAIERAKCPKGTFLRDVHVVDLGIRNPEKHGGRYAVIFGDDTRTIFTAPGVRV